MKIQIFSVLNLFGENKLKKKNKDAKMPVSQCFDPLVDAQAPKSWSKYTTHSISFIEQYHYNFMQTVKLFFLIS